MYCVVPCQIFEICLAYRWIQRRFRGKTITAIIFYRFVSDHMRISFCHTHAEKVHQQLSVRQVARIGDAGFVARGAQQHAARALPDQQSVHSTRWRHGPHGRLSGPVLHS